MPSTNKKATITGIEIYRIANGKIAERWGNFDQLGMLQQLGVVPMPGQG
jgi:predicted ester cyclase